MLRTIPKLSLCFLFVLSFSVPVQADTAMELLGVNQPDRFYKLAAHAEVGFLAPLEHQIQYSKTGSVVDYVEDGGQDVLFAVNRFSLDWLVGKNTFVLLYQPLDLQTEVIARHNYVIDNENFPEGEPMKFRFSFPFFRGSYMYNLSNDPSLDVEVGGSIQLRNARIEFASADGELFRASRDIGPVPLMKLRVRKTQENGFWYGMEMDGSYAAVDYLNGDDDSDVVGALLDFSLRSGVTLKHGIRPFVNLRYLGGGAEGTTGDYEGYGGDGWVKNWLHFMTVSVGVSVF
tara:strand:+ start:670 stop:1533 length:864 start_codon:yes stop_codon:yes gene_type:complete